MSSKATVHLWFDKDALEAAEFYAATFPDSHVGAIHRNGDDSVFSVSFTVCGIPCLGINGGPHFRHSEAFSFQILTDDQEETDRYWDAIVGNGGQESQCSWCKDKWGVSWQITPRALMQGLTDPDPDASARVREAMMGMSKIDIAVIEAARKRGS